MKFNKTQSSTMTVNAAGGQAYAQSPELEFVSILLTSFVEDSCYRKGDATIERLKGLCAVIDPLFAAKAVVYARTKFGMRSITHVAASELAKYVSGQKWARQFFNEVIYRPDDILEILAYHKTHGKLSNAMKSGLAQSFDKFDAYHLGKYRGEGKAFKMVDAVNLLHPKPFEKNKEALQNLVKGTLRSQDTWEVELSKAGQEGTSKGEAWKTLLKEKKLGYFALIRNLRNIIQQADDETLALALVQVTDAHAIKRSLVFPFRYLTAINELALLNTKASRMAIQSLNQAVELSFDNVPAFSGETLVVLDISGSMREIGPKSPHIIGSLFAAALAKRNFCDIMVFAETAQYVAFNPSDTLATIAGKLQFGGGGTNFHSIFQTAKRKYDRIMILSDMQGWIGSYSPKETFKEYKRRTGADPFIYSFDLKNYGSMQFPERNVFAVAGFSEKIFDIVKFMESDKTSLIGAINAIQF